MTTVTLNTSAALSGALALVPSLEEVYETCLLDTGTVSASKTIPLMVAPYNVKLEQVSFVFGFGVTASNTDYWRVELVRYTASQSFTIASKTTQTAGSGGEGVTIFKDWNFNATAFGTHQVLGKGDTLMVRMTPVGSPAGLVQPSITWRAPGTDDTPTAPPTPLVVDTFSRADTTSGLGSADSGQAWTMYGSWGIVGGQAYNPVPTANDAAILDAGSANAQVEMQIVALSTSASCGLRVRHLGDVSTGSGITHNFGALLWFTAPGTNATIGSFSQTLVAGDSVRIIALGNTVTVFRDAGTTGSWVQICQVTESRNNSVTRHGIRSTNNATGANRYDNFKVFSA